MPEPPIPLPSGYVCPNCGHKMQEKPTFCPLCGATLKTTQSGPRWLRILGAVILVLIAMPLGAAGACFLIFSGFNDMAMISTAAGILVVTVLLLWGAAKLLSR